MNAAQELAALQRWFAHVVTDPHDVASGLAAAAAHGCGATPLCERVRSGPRLDAAERLEVYRHGYQARLIECLADDYPALRHVLGKARFDQLCCEYIVRHPSRSPSLNVFGAHMPAFLRERGGEASEFHAELAALEWAIVEVIHAQDAAPIALTALAALSPQRWAELALVPSPALRLLQTEYPVNASYQAFRDQVTCALPLPCASRTLVRRRGVQIWRETVAPEAVALLQALMHSEPVASALATAAEGGVTTEQVGGWFQHWIGAGLFVGFAPSAA